MIVRHWNGFYYFIDGSENLTKRARVPIVVYYIEYNPDKRLNMREASIRLTEK